MLRQTRWEAPSRVPPPPILKRPGLIHRPRNRGLAVAPFAARGARAVNHSATLPPLTESFMPKVSGLAQAPVPRVVGISLGTCCVLHAAGRTRVGSTLQLNAPTPTLFAPGAGAMFLGWVAKAHYLKLDDQTHVLKVGSAGAMRPERALPAYPGDPQAYTLDAQRTMCHTVASQMLDSSSETSKVRGSASWRALGRVWPGRCNPHAAGRRTADADRRPHQVEHGGVGPLSQPAIERVPRHWRRARWVGCSGRGRCSPRPPRAAPAALAGCFPPLRSDQFSFRAVAAVLDTYEPWLGLNLRKTCASKLVPSGSLPPVAPAALQKDESTFVCIMLDHLTLVFEGRPLALQDEHEALCRRCARPPCPQGTPSLSRGCVAQSARHLVGPRCLGRRGHDHSGVATPPPPLPRRRRPPAQPALHTGRGAPASAPCR